MAKLTTMPISLRVQTSLASVLAGTPAGRAFTTQWILGIRPKRWRLLRERNSRGFRLILPPADRFYADPFVFEHRGRTCVFFEDYRFASKKAVISCMEVGRQGELSEPVVVLDGPEHISYPFIFRSNGVVYMIPETSSRKRVELHRCTSFPFEWELEDVLLDLPASDATLWRTDGTFWLFANMSAGTGGPDCEDLHVFFADSLHATWESHPANPVVVDTRGARPAGRLFLDEGRLIRPAQDCSSGYGQGVILKQITALSRREYREHVVTTIPSGWISGAIGTHHMDHNEDLEVIDVKLRRLASPRMLLQASSRRVRRWISNFGAGKRKR